jgi:NADH dehydrogenase
MMNVALAGGTGFIGRAVLQKLVKAGHHVKAQIRPGSLLKISKFSGMESRYIYYDSPSQMAKNVEDCGAVINLVGIIKETKDTSFDFAHHLVPMALVKAAQDAGVKRFIQMSALGVGSGIETEYFKTKRLGENVVKSSGLDWTIFRPSLVFGPEDHMVGLLAKIIKYMPFFPVIGDGKYKFMPVHVENVADGFVQAIDNPETFGQIYDVVGPETVTFDGMLDLIGKAMGKKHVPKLHQPLSLIMLKARLWGRFLPGPLSPDAIKMLVAGSTSDDDSFFKTFDTQPIPFGDGIREYLRK